MVSAAIRREKSKNTLKIFPNKATVRGKRMIRNVVALVTLSFQITIRILLMLGLTMIAFLYGISVMSVMLLYTLNGQSTFVL